MPWCSVTPVIDPAMQRLCAREYPGHPRGCPNYGWKAGCPPCPLFHEAYDRDGVIAVYNAFDLAGHVARMRTAHPGWSQRQLVCCLYWQPKARRDLKEEIRRFFATADGRGLTIVQTPEAMGVNVTETLRPAGVVLEWPPVTVAYQVVLAARRVGRKEVANG